MAIREDITDVVKSKKAYEEQLNFTNMLLDSEENIVIVTKNNQIDKMNKAFYRAFGYKDMESFISQHECICDLFIQRDGYLIQTTCAGIWTFKRGAKYHILCCTFT